MADGAPGEVASWLLIDNVKASGEAEPEEPTEPESDITEGLEFEDADDALLFAGTGSAQDATIERVSYEVANATAPANGGSYALKLSHASSCWPSFRLSFGKTLEAGTTVTFDVYGDYDSNAAGRYMKLELAAASKGVATSDDPNQVVWTQVKTWKTATITLTADTDHIDLFYNVADGRDGNVASWLIVDNVKAEEPAAGDEGITGGLDFEDADDALLFTGTGSAQDVTVERVTYANAGVSAPANGGSYALKLSHASNCWPAFRLSFGKTLKAGTTITFDVYGDYNALASVKYMKLELAAASKSVATSDDPNQVVWTLVKTWKTATITLTADTDHIDLFYNVADGSQGNVASWILLDNIKASEPSTQNQLMQLNLAKEPVLHTRSVRSIVQNLWHKFFKKR